MCVPFEIGGLLAQFLEYNQWLRNEWMKEWMLSQNLWWSLGHKKIMISTISRSLINFYKDVISKYLGHGSEYMHRKWKNVQAIWVISITDGARFVHWLVDFRVKVLNWVIVKEYRFSFGSPLQYSCLGNSMDREEPGGLLSMGSQRTGHNSVTK